MALQSLVQGLVSQAFTILGDLAKDVQYIHYLEEEATYSTATGKVATAEVGETSDVKAVRVTEDLQDQATTDPSWEEYSGAVKWLIPNDANLKHVPVSGDIILFDDQHFLVKAFVIDPADALWTVVTIPEAKPDEVLQ
ncbi:hypothetical protein KAR91_14200 [Candidatus Pacearchaeota archaeon]|nr:hypothetical protein [Candidatus Pacearchaeota archaeon]